MTQHTPRPWASNSADSFELGVYGNGYRIAKMTGGEINRDIANARLIAEAPALLMLANLYALDFTDEKQARAEFGDAAVDRELHRRAIVAKATGAA